MRSLDSFPSIFCAGEIFHAGQHTYHREFQFPYVESSRGRLARVLSSFVQKRRVEEHLRKFYARAGRGVVAVGFKIMVSQAMRFPAIMPFLRELGVTGFYLYRRNTFATALSYFKASVSGIYHQDNADRAHVQQTVTANEEEFYHLLQACQRDKERVRELQRVYGGRLLTYEDMTASWDEFIATVGGDIGLPGLRVPQVLSKVRTSGDSVLISNEDVLRGKFCREDSG